MERERLTIELTDAGVATTSALIDRARGAPRRSAVLLAHGSGAGFDHPWMERAAVELAARGFDVMRFQYPYMERASLEGSRRPPDRGPALEAAHVAAIEAFRRRFEGRRVLLAGKSLGGRISTLVAAKGALAHGLVLFGYPLHPPKRPEKERSEHARSEHFPALVQPALFLQGTRDEFATPTEIERALRKYAGRATLSIVEGGDHSFTLPAARKTPVEAVIADLAARVDAWERETWPD
jgi:predicted alpha/beta-hydrolase family hydrolase